MNENESSQDICMNCLFSIYRYFGDQNESERKTDTVIHESKIEYREYGLFQYLMFSKRRKCLTRE